MKEACDKRNGRRVIITAVLLLVGNASLVVQAQEGNSGTSAEPERSELEVLTGAALPDVHGPMRLQLPPNLCAIELPSALTGLLPDHPLAIAEATTPEKLAVIKAYHHTESIRSVQKRHCAPVLAEAAQISATKPLPQECGLPANPVALLNPLHPMADLSRADVKEALEAHVNAKHALEGLRRRCRLMAGLSESEQEDPEL